jgi:ribosomal protein L11 methyltransferase
MVDAWFAGPVAELGEEWVERGVERLGEERVEQEDWLASYRQRAQPLALGERFYVDPREPGEAVQVPAGRWLLRLPARTAFGIGSHESTRLAVALLEAAPVDGARVLDVGTGTGVLAFAAQQLGAGSVVAFDVDPAAVFPARLNAQLNDQVLRGRRVLLYTGTVDALAPEACFDLVLVNVVPEQVAGALPGLAARLKVGGRLLFSGLLATQQADLSARLAELDLAVEGARQEGEWAALALRRVAPPAAGDAPGNPGPQPSSVEGDEEPSPSPTHLCSPSSPEGGEGGR